MSAHLTNLAWEIELPSSQKLVLLALAHLAVLSTGECFPTVRKLAFTTGLSDSGVRAQLAYLAKKGVVDRFDTEAGACYRVNVRQAT